MITSILQSNLQHALDAVRKVVDTRPTLPVLANVLIEAGDGVATITATNLEVTASVKVGAKTHQPGAITLPAKTLSELVKTLPPERVDLTLDASTQTVNMRCGAANSNIKGITADEFPVTPPFERADVVLPVDVLRELVSLTAFSAAKDDSRPILTGVYIEMSGNTLTAASADGYRLSVYRCEVEQTFDEPVNVVVPVDALQQVLAMLDANVTAVKVQLPGERDLVRFRTPSAVVSSQILAGRFPDFTAIIPRNTTTTVTFEARDLLRLATKAEIFARDNANSARFEVTTNGIKVTGKSAERGDLVDEMGADVTGELGVIAMNVKYVKEAMSALAGQYIAMHLNGSGNPALFEVDAGETYRHVIMPMSMKEGE